MPAPSVSVPPPWHRRRAPRLVAAALLVLAALFVAFWQVSRARCFVLTGEVVCRAPTDAPRVALTFDDGPTPHGVDALLPILAAHDVRATFFVTGIRTRQSPELVKRLHDAGHEIGNHSFTHQRMVGRPLAFYVAEIAETAAAIERAGAPRPRYFRPPYGKKLIGLPRAVARNDHIMVTWDIDEPAETDPARYAEQIVRQAKPGSIILIHPMFKANATARAALPLLIKGLRTKGYEITTVGNLLEKSRQRKAQPRG